MQKNILSTLAIMGGCVLLLSSCEKKEDGFLIDNLSKDKIFTATMPIVEEIAESKTSTADGKSVIWNEGDMVSLFNGKNVNEKYGVKEGEGGKASTILVKVTDSDSPAGSDATFDANIAYYPYGTVNYKGNGSNHSLEVTIPNTQTYAPNSFGKGAMPMVAVTASKDDDNLLFKNLLGLIKLQFKGSDGVDKIKSITIKGNINRKLSGKATVSCSNTATPKVSFDEVDVYNYVKLDCAEGVAINKTTATSFWIALPPTTFSEGISVTVELGDGCIVTKSTTSELTIARSMVTPMAALTVTRENAQLNVPDPAFKAYLLEKADMDNDGVLTLNDAKAWNKSTRDKLFYVNGKNITSLKGVEHFTALEKLYCAKNKLTTLDVSKNTALTRLDCYENKLTILDLSKNTALTWLYCSDNQLATLDVSNCTALSWLACLNNQLTALDVSNCTALATLWCYDNPLTTLDLSKNAALTDLSCSGNQLTTLDLSKNTALTKLSCFDNQLTTLDLSKNTALTELSCSGNQLTTLDVSKNTALTELGCSGNRLTTLDVSKNTALKNLSFDNNQLTNIDVSKNAALRILYFGGNHLTTLDVGKNTALKLLNCNNNKLTTLDLSKNTALTHLYCGNNQLTSLDLSKNTALTGLSCYGNQLTTLDLSKNTALTDLNCEGNQLTTLDVSMTKLGNGNSMAYFPFYCNMPTLNILYLKTGWSIRGINNGRYVEYIHPNTVIEYKD